MGSSGFWDMQRSSSKATIDGLKTAKALAIKKFKMTERDLENIAKYEASTRCLGNSLSELLHERIAKQKPLNDIPPKVEKDFAGRLLPAVGYANISAYVIKINAKVARYDGPDFHQSSDEAW